MIRRKSQERGFGCGTERAEETFQIVGVEEAEEEGASPLAYW